MNAPLPLPALDEIRAHEAGMVEIRSRTHQNPQLAYEEHATSDLVAKRLADWGWQVHRGLGGTGVVGTLREGTSSRRIGLRADMDALPIAETSGKPWASRVFCKTHACGHDGHTAMLHNAPDEPEGQFAVLPGFAMASSDACVAKVNGNGEIARAQAAVHGATAEVDSMRRYPVLNNHAAETAFCMNVIRDWLGEGALQPQSEEKVPGCYVDIVNGSGAQGGCMVHNAADDFNDRVLSTGATYRVRLAEAWLKPA